MELYDRIESYLTKKLYPFWYARVAAPDGGFTTYFDRNGAPTGADRQDDHPADPLHLHALPRHQERLRRRQGAGAAGAGAGMVPEDLPRPEHDGWLWIVDKDGRARLHGQDHVRPELRDLLHERMRPCNGKRQARGRQPSTPSTSSRNTRQTRLWRLSGDVPAGLAAAPRRRLRRGQEKLRRPHAPHGGLHRPLRADARRYPSPQAPGGDRGPVVPHVPPAPWTGISQFSLDFTPLRAIMFKTVWGSDRDNEGAPGR